MVSQFDEFRKMSRRQLEALEPDAVRLFSDDTIEENFTIIVRPDEKVVQLIKVLITELKQTDPPQFYYPLSQLHLTVLGRLPVSVGQNAVIEAVEQIVPKYSWEFELRGCASNEWCASVTAYPTNFFLHTLRMKLRELLQVRGDDYSIHLPLYEHVGWINFMRYLEKPSPTLLSALLKMNERSFGEFTATKIEIYRNTSKVLDPLKISLVHSLSL